MKLKKRLQLKIKHETAAKVIQIWWKYNRPSEVERKKIMIKINKEIEVYTKDVFTRTKVNQKVTHKE